MHTDPVDGFVYEAQFRIPTQEPSSMEQPTDPGMRFAILNVVAIVWLKIVQYSQLKPKRRGIENG